MLRPSVTSEPGPRRLFDLTSIEREALASEVRDWQGKIRMIVHPYHLLSTGRYRGDKHLRAVNEGTTEMLVSAHRPPLLCLVERSTIDRFERILCDVLTKPVYVIPTWSEDPEPVTAPSVAPWATFADRLREADVSDILVSGMFLHQPLNGCVGKTVRELREQFAVELSHLCYPETRASIDAS